MKSSSIKEDDTCATTLFKPLTKETAPKIRSTPEPP